MAESKSPSKDIATKEGESSTIETGQVKVPMKDLVDRKPLQDLLDFEFVEVLAVGRINVRSGLACS